VGAPRQWAQVGTAERLTARRVGVTTEPSGGWLPLRHFPRARDSGNEQAAAPAEEGAGGRAGRHVDDRAGRLVRHCPVLAAAGGAAGQPADVRASARGAGPGRDADRSSAGSDRGGVAPPRRAGGVPDGRAGCDAGRAAGPDQRPQRGRGDERVRVPWRAAVPGRHERPRRAPSTWQASPSARSASASASRLGCWPQSSAQASRWGR
jgi:hypothetical protein